MAKILKPYLEAGKIVGTHGVRGELRMEPWCDSAQFLMKIKHFYKDPQGKQAVEVVSSRPHKSLLLVKLQGVDTVEQGDMLRGKVFYLDRKDVKLPEGRFFIQDLIGLQVLDADTGRVYGTLTDVIATGANDVYEVTSEEGKKYLVPVIPDVVVDILPEEDKVLLRPIRGIFEDED